MSRRLTEPIPEPADRPAQRRTVAVVALGANLGDRAATIAAAVHDLARLPLVDEVVASEPIESVALKPDGPDASAPPYLNAVALVTTRLAPTVLLGYLQKIEKDHGRVRPSAGSASGGGTGAGVGGERRARRLMETESIATGVGDDRLVWADRTLDLDLIAYGDVRSDSADLTLPHPRAADRDFVLAPWLAVDPDAVLPGHGRVDRLLAELQERA
ncbi:MAG TPA: 2-amino-4-hydroxy-6-hydroxymethyldihydropteridine diphosphokinase [Microbacterium sp.]|nr:2-amino-4-hydroxy-6-hydroxymethyldihydropteridine diphosphokinase [Microbacterium sp.]